MHLADVNSGYLVFYMPVSNTIATLVQLHAHWACLEGVRGAELGSR